MKLKPYQLSRWCDAAVQGRRKWLFLGSGAAVLLLSFLLGLAWLILPVLLLFSAALGLYLLHRHHAFGASYQRLPRPQDALCETILIDAGLIGSGTRLRAAAQPIDVADSLSLRLGSGALLLGSAITLTADVLPLADRSALLSAVHSLNIKPSRLRSHNPVLEHTHAGSVSVLTVRDGMSNRRYYVGAPADVARCCASIWEGHTRPLEAQDHHRIADTAAYIAQGECRVYAWATALDGEDPIFLGMAGVGEAVHLPALQDAATLRTMGLTLMLDAGDQPDTDLDCLRLLMELPDHHARADIHLTPHTAADANALAITCTPGDSLVEPIRQLRRNFSTIEDTLRRFSQLLALSLAIALLCGSRLMPILLTGLFLCAAIFIGVDLTAPKLRWSTMLCCCLPALLAHFFLQTQTPAAAAMAAGIITTAAGYCTLIRMGGKGFSLQKDSPRCGLYVTIAAVVCTAAWMLHGLLAGLSSLMPLGFSLLISAAICLLMLFENKILR